MLIVQLNATIGMMLVSWQFLKLSF